MLLLNKEIKKQKFYDGIIFVCYVNKAYRKRVSIYEWLRDHDKLNSGRIPRETFKRSINLCNLDLQQSEIETIMN
jgi:hypothetical protein